MFQGKFREVSKAIQGCFKEVSSVIQKCFMMFQGSIKEVKCVSRKCHKKFQGCLKNLSMKFCLQFCCSMNLIAATRAEGGLVSLSITIDLLKRVFT